MINLSNKDDSMQMDLLAFSGYCVFHTSDGLVPVKVEDLTHFVRQYMTDLRLRTVRKNVYGCGELSD